MTCGTIAGPDPVFFNVVFFNVEEYERRKWANVKYRDDHPVFTNMDLIDRPSQRVFTFFSDLRL
jgi:hypothetical protein